MINNIEQLIEKLEEYGWTLHNAEIDDWNPKSQTLTLENTSPAGVDFLIQISGETAEDIIRDIEECAKDFNIEKHIKFNLGQKGAPDVVVLTKDAQNIQEILTELPKKLLEELQS